MENIETKTRGRGRPSLNKKIRKLAVQVDLEDWEEFITIVHSKNMNGSQVVRNMIKQYVKQEKEIK